MSRTGKLLILVIILGELEEENSLFTPLEVADKTGNEKICK